MDTETAQTNSTTSAPLAILEALPLNTLQSLGLQEDDLGAIQAVVERIAFDTPESISQFGRDVAEHTSSYADDLLAQVRSGDLQDIGKKLNEIVGIAKDIDARGLAGAPSRLPIVGKFLDRLRKGSQQLLARYETGSAQIDRLVQEVGKTQASIAERNASLNDMYAAVMEEYRLLGVHIAAGKLHLQKMQARIADEKNNIGSDPARAQALMDYEALMTNLDKRVGDLTVLQHSALQSLPTIRMVQANNQLLADKFNTIETVTIPAWKRELMLAISLNEQRNAVELATAIDDTTNDFMRRNAELLYRNSVEAARANQRLVIDMDTLKKVNSNLIKTVEDVMRIQHDGMAMRLQAESQISQMRKEIGQRIAK